MLEGVVQYIETDNTVYVTYTRREPRCGTEGNRVTGVRFCPSDLEATILVMDFWWHTHELHAATALDTHFDYDNGYGLASYYGKLEVEASIEGQSCNPYPCEGLCQAVSTLRRALEGLDDAVQPGFARLLEKLEPIALRALPSTML